MELVGTTVGTLSLHAACELFSGHEVALGSALGPEQDPTLCRASGLSAHWSVPLQRLGLEIAQDDPHSCSAFFGGKI